MQYMYAYMYCVADFAINFDELKWSFMKLIVFTSTKTVQVKSLCKEFQAEIFILFNDSLSWMSVVKCRLRTFLHIAILKVNAAVVVFEWTINGRQFLSDHFQLQSQIMQEKFCRQDFNKSQLNKINKQTDHHRRWSQREHQTPKLMSNDNLINENEGTEIEVNFFIGSIYI